MKVGIYLEWENKLWQIINLKNSFKSTKYITQSREITFEEIKLYDVSL